MCFVSISPQKRSLPAEKEFSQTTLGISYFPIKIIEKMYADWVNNPEN